MAALLIRSFFVTSGVASQGPVRGLGTTPTLPPGTKLSDPILFAMNIATGALVDSGANKFFEPSVASDGGPDMWLWQQSGDDLSGDTFLVVIGVGPAG